MIPIKLTAGPVIGALSTVVIDQTALMPIGATVGIIFSVWVLARKTTQWEMTLRQHTRALERGEQIMAWQTKALTEIQQIISAKCSVTLTQPPQDALKHDIESDT